MTFPNWTREPLVHFLLGGALLYAFFAWTGGASIDPGERVIAVDREQQAELALRFERIMGRAPTDGELDAQIEQFVRDEVLYREALRLGLDQGDAVVRRRLVSKMDMAASAAAEVASADEKTLRAFFEDNRERYAGAEMFSFDQQYFADEAAARLALRSTEDGPAGDPISLPRSMTDAALGEIEVRFGSEFARAIEALDPGQAWQGPIRSGFGWHLVRVSERTKAAAEFEALRDRIENDWRSEAITAREERAFRILRDAYSVEIDR